MNAHARISSQQSLEPVLATLAEIAATLAGAGGALDSLRRVLALLADMGLTDAGVAWVDGLFLRGVAGRAADAPPQAMTRRVKTFLARGEAGLLRNEKPPVIAAPIRMGEAQVGLLAARVKAGVVSRDDLKRLALVANLLGPALVAAARGVGAAVTAADAKSIVGDSPALRAALEEARRVAPTDLPVLLRGESGVGKELFAQFIHDHSPRAQKPLLKVNCAALTETLLECELFGHERGAFTGADSRREGRFALADGGTILLDEIGDISPAFQGKLLRVI